MTPTIQSTLLARANCDDTAVRGAAGTWTWREHLAAGAGQAQELLRRADSARPMHVGVLLGNSAPMLVALAAAGLGGYVLCGINTTRRGDGLRNDIRTADCQFLLTDSHHREFLAGLDLGALTVIDVSEPHWQKLSCDPHSLDVHRSAVPEDVVMLVFTSGTSGDPKAVQITDETVMFAGRGLAERFGIGTSDVCYLSMPLFHSNAIFAGWSVAINSGAAMAPASFSASRFLSDIRAYGATYMNYVGKPLAYVLATPRRDDDGINPLRVAFGNEASARDIEEFADRFDCTVVDGFGSTEAAVAIHRAEGCPPGSVGKGSPGVAVYDPHTVIECPAAQFDSDGALLNPDEAIGELVNTGGAGRFAGYYNNPAATRERLRHGMYWSGDLAYRDADGWIYLAGRTSDWMRVDGENLTTAPIERVLARFDPIGRVAVYPASDERVGDQVMAAVVLREGATVTPADFEQFLLAQRDLSPKAWPRFVRFLAELPVTATNKVLKRTLIAQGATADGGELWVRRGKTSFGIVVPPDSESEACAPPPRTGALP